MGLNKSEILRLKGVCEPLEDIIKRHYGDINYVEYEYIFFLYRESNPRINWCIEDKTAFNLIDSLFTLKVTADYEWQTLMHQNDKLDTGEKDETNRI